MRGWQAVAVLLGMTLVSGLAAGCGGGKASEEKYAQLKTGMTVDEVKAVMGGEPTITRQEEVEYPTEVKPTGADAGKKPKIVMVRKPGEIMIWKSGSNAITVRFVDGKVVDLSS